MNGFVSRRDAATFAFAALLAVAFCIAWGVELRSRTAPAANHPYGEILIHGIAPLAVDAPLDFHASLMPSAGIFGAALQHHLPRRAASAVILMLMAGSALLIFSLGRSLHSGAAGLIALAAAGAMGLVVSRPRTHYLLHDFMILLVANLCVLWTTRPDKRRTLLLGSALGLALLVRSTLFLFPAVLAAFVWLSAPAGSRSARLKEAWPLWALPFAFLMPWILVNAAVLGRFVPFEGERVSRNVIAGALGLISTMEGADLAAHEGIEGTGQGILLWAAGQILSHPFQYAEAVVRRMAYALSIHPFLAVLGASGLAYFRSSKDHQGLGLLAAYLLIIHCLMGVEPKVFDPLWPLLAAAGAGLAAEGTGARREEDAGAFAPRITGAAWAAAALAGAASLAVLAAYPLRLYSSGLKLDRAVAAFPNDDWLRLARARRAILESRFADAAGDLREARRAAPEFADYAVEEAWTLFLAGEDASGALSAARPGLRGWIHARPYLVPLLSGLNRLDLDDAAAERDVARARARWGDVCRVIDPKTEKEREFEEAVCESPPGFDEEILRLLQPLPARRRRDLLAKVAAFAGAEASLAEEASRLESAAARPSDGAEPRAAKHAPPPRPSPPAPAPAAPVPSVPRTPSPDGEKPPLDKAEDHLRKGNPGRALEEVSKAIAGIRDETVEGRAVELLERASALALRPEDRLQAALAFQSLRRYGRAVALLESISPDWPRAAETFEVKGICEFLNGSPEAAAADLERAAAVGPSRLSVYLSLGSVLISLGETDRAREVFDRGLALPSVDGDRALRETLRAEREALRTR